MPVYFIGNGKGQVKIGFSQNPSSRLASLQTASPYKLELLAVIPGGEAVESDLHKKYSWCRLEGEWFTRCPEIDIQIEVAKKCYPDSLDYSVDAEDRKFWEDAFSDLCAEANKIRSSYESKIKVLEEEIERLEEECDNEEEELDAAFDEKTKHIHPWWLLDKK